MKNDLPKEIIENISGRNETLIKMLIESLGFIEGEDFIHQFATNGSIRNGYVLDFAFVQERVNIEADGKDYREKRKKMRDETRDKRLYEEGWVVIRIEDEKLDGFGISFFRNLIREVVLERRKLDSESKYAKN